jgi:hypothetical protein
MAGDAADGSARGGRRTVAGSLSSAYATGIARSR